MKKRTDLTNGMFNISNVEDVSFSRITHIGQGPTLNASDAKKLAMSEVVKKGSGPVLNADNIGEIIANDIMQMDDLDPALKQDLASDVRNNDRGGALSRIKRVARSLSVEKVDALVNLLNRLPW